MLVPACHRRLGHSMHRSVGTSSATLVLISRLGAMAYVVLRRGEAGRLGLALGYGDVGTGLLLAGPSVVGARGGAALAHRFETRGLRWSFALIALVVAGRLVWGASRERSAPGGGNHGGLLTVPFGKFGSGSTSSESVCLNGVVSGSPV